MAGVPKKNQVPSLLRSRNVDPLLHLVSGVRRTISLIPHFFGQGEANVTCRSNLADGEAADVAG
jgi:hypothetical protein